ncbi:MAG: hypothetical protein N3A38_14965 [Planctomycetota bacterium]|nr:hypothetical protein [Planctomycetota bacterium]
MGNFLRFIRDKSAASALRLARRFGQRITYHPVSGSSVEIYALIEPESADTDPGGSGAGRRLTVIIPRQEGLDFSAIPSPGIRIEIGTEAYVVAEVVGDLQDLAEAATWTLRCRRLAGDDLDADR